jgi:hypothetical protein
LDVGCTPSLCDGSKAVDTVEWAGLQTCMDAHCATMVQGSKKRRKGDPVTSIQPVSSTTVLRGARGLSLASDAVYVLQVHPFSV